VGWVCQEVEINFFSLSGGRDQLFFFVGWVCEVSLKIYISSIYISSTSAGTSLSDGRNEFFFFCGVGLWSAAQIINIINISGIWLLGGRDQGFFFLGWVCEVLLLKTFISWSSSASGLLRSRDQGFGFFFLGSCVKCCSKYPSNEHQQDLFLGSWKVFTYILKNLLIF